MTDLTLSEKRARAGALGRHARDRVIERPANLRIARPVAELRQGRTDWFTVENLTQENTDVFIYSEIGYFGVTAADFVAELQTIHSAQITVSINSPGGDVFDGIAIYNALVKHPAKIVVEIDGWAASAASIIAMAGDTIRIARNATMIIHNAWGICIGNAVNMRETADAFDKIDGTIADTYMQRAGGTVESWLAAMAKETWYVGAEAVDARLADEVMERDPSPDSKAQNSWDLSIFNFTSRAEAGEPYIPEPAVEELPVEAPAEPEKETPNDSWRSSVGQSLLSAGRK